MKLSQLRPCDNCHGPLSHGHFYVVRVTQALVLPRTTNQVLGLTQYFGGNLALAEMFAPDDDAIKILGDEQKELMYEFLLCQDCFLRPVDLAMLMEARREATSK